MKGVFFVLLFAILGVPVARSQNESNCPTAPEIIYQSGWRSDDWVTGAQGALVEETSIVLRQGTNKTLAALTDPFTEFSLVKAEGDFFQQLGHRLLDPGHRHAGFRGLPVELKHWEDV